MWQISEFLSEKKKIIFWWLGGTKCVLWKLMHTGSIDFYKLILIHVMHYYRTYYLWKHLYHLPCRYFWSSYSVSISILYRITSNNVNVVLVLLTSLPADVNVIWRFNIISFSCNYVYCLKKESIRNMLHAVLILILLHHLLVVKFSVYLNRLVFVMSERKNEFW